MPFRVKIQSSVVVTKLADVERNGNQISIDFVTDPDKPVSTREAYIDLDDITMVQYKRCEAADAAAGGTAFDSDELTMATFRGPDGEKWLHFGTPEDLETIRSHFGTPQTWRSER